MEESEEGVEVEVEGEGEKAEEVVEPTAGADHSLERGGWGKKILGWRVG